MINDKAFRTCSPPQDGRVDRDKLYCKVLAHEVSSPLFSYDSESEVLTLPSQGI